jgi:hypothetical protein
MAGHGHFQFTNLSNLTGAPAAARHITVLF